MVRRHAFFAVLLAELLCACLVGLGSSAKADEAVTRQDADACEPDVHRLCDSVFPDEKLVADCLVDKRTQLSVPCAKALARPRPPKPDEK